MKFSKQEYWSGVPLREDSCFPTQGLDRHLLHLLHWQMDSVPIVLPGKPLVALTVKNLPTVQETRVIPWVRKIPWWREWLPTPVFLPGELHEQRSLAGYNSWGCKDMTEWLSRSVQFLPPVVFLYLSCFQNKHGTIALHSSEVMCSLVLFQI